MILRGFPLAFDGSTDVTATVNGVDGEFEVSEELASLNSLHAGKNIFKDTEKILIQNNPK